MPEKTLERLCGRIKASLWRGRTRTVIVERPPQKPAGPHGVPLSHMSEYLKNKIRSLRAPKPQRENTFWCHSRPPLRTCRSHYENVDPCPAHRPNPTQVCSTYPHISGRGTHHGRCWGGHDGVWEGREGVLVGMLVGVLVLMLVLMLVELSAQVGRGAKRGTAVGALGRQETGVELLAQKVLLCREEGGALGQQSAISN